MPIFISRFSPDRGLVGLQRSLRVVVKAEAQTKQADSQQDNAQRAASRQGDVQVEQATQAAQTPPLQADQDVAAAQAGGAEGQQAVDGRDGLAAVGNTGLALTLDISQAEAQASNQEAAASAAQGDVGAVAQQLQGQLADSGTGAVSGQTDGAAADTAPPEQPPPVTENQGEAVQTVDAQGAEQKDQAREGQAVDQGKEVQAPAALPPAEAQREQVRAASREIGSGLSQDAKIQSNLDAKESSRNASRAVERNQSQEARQSQEEARNLQAERRKLQDEVRQTEQRIRQLQGRSSGAGGVSAKTANDLMAGSNVNLLAG